MPYYLWRVKTKEKAIFLTFDDGPIPEVTPWVLDTLRAHSAKATFFCVGENVMKYPHIFEQLKNEGHSIGNHTYNHLNGWQTDDPTYFENVRLCAEQVDSRLFRPPYGRLKSAQRKELARQGYRIVLWDVLTGDFDPGFSEEKCLQKVLKSIAEGSIIVLHDSLKAEKKLRYLLPRILEHFAQKGYRFDAL